MSLPDSSHHLLRYAILAIAFLVSLTPLRGQVDDADVLEFAIITDTHQFGSTADVRYADANVQAFVDYCNNTPSLQFALFGGDFFNAYDTDHEQAIRCLEQAAEGFSRLKIPFYATRGNHDCNGKCRTPEGASDNSQIITDRQYYDIFNPLSAASRFYHPDGIVTDPDNPYGNYYYVDFERQRIRLIVLNNYDRDSLETPGYHGQQMRWFAEKALDFRMKEDATTWGFFVLGHTVTIDHSHNPITRLLHAYVRGQNIFDADEGVTYGRHFSTTPLARFIGFIYGHYHEDNYTNWDGYNLISLTRGYATGSEVNRDNVSFDHFIINTRTQTIEERRIGRGKSRIYSYATPMQLHPGVSFPEADGMGHYTVGGRFGRIFHVSNLDDDGPGSLRAAVNEAGARTILFDTCGTIKLDSALIISHDSITIAGQSADAPGIFLRGAPLVINASEVMLRYLDVEQIHDADFGHRGLMIDHITAHSDTTSAIAIRRTEDVTIQSCRISSRSQTEPALLAGGFKATYMLNHVHSSPLAIGFSDCEGENRWIQIARNLVTGWQHHAMYGGGHQGEFTIHENYFIPDSTTRHFKVLDVAEDGTGRYWARINPMLTPNGLQFSDLIQDRLGLAYHPAPADTVMRPLMAPVAQPHSIEPANSCLVISAFNFVYLYGMPDVFQTQAKVLREAGSHYRPEPVCHDSLTGSDVIGYLDRIVKPERSIVILFDNDAHCQIDGYAYLAGLRDPLASDSAYVGIVSCGDFLQGGVAGSMTHGHAIIDVMKRIRYDAITLGTHDFDFDLSHTRALLSELDAPTVCANLRNIRTGETVFEPFVISQYGRRRVAFVGVTTPSTQITNAPSFDDEDGDRLYDFDPLHTYQRVQAAVNEARRRGADYVVVLSQLGDIPDRFDISAPGLIAATTGIDAVLDGHSHAIVSQRTYNNRRGQPVAYAQGGQRFTNIGKLVINPDGLVLTDVIPTQQMKYRDAMVTEVIDSIKAYYMGSAEEYAGLSHVNLLRPKEYVRGDEHSINAGNLVTDAMRWAARADIAWLNVGSVRSSVQAGELSRGDIRELVPYENELMTFTISGRVLKSFVNQLLSNLPSDGGYLSPVSGLHAVLSHTKRGRYKPIDIQIYDQTYSRYAPIDDNRIYTIVTTDYCMSIIKRMKFKNINLQLSGELYNEAVFRYISQQLNGLIEPTEELTAERIIVLR